MPNSRALIGAAFMLTILFAIACSNGQELLPIPTPGAAEPTPAPRPVSIPADERSHEDRLEW